MGYESKLYIVQESDIKFPSDNGKVWAEVIGMVDLCKCYPIVEVFDEVANGYIYADDGNTRIEEDCYGSPLMVASLSAVITRLKIIARDEDYWRAKVALDFLESVRKTNPNCKVYHFGY